jgi:UDP-N-acetylglucosamine transferase subunit ALG13
MRRLRIGVISSVGGHLREVCAALRPLVSPRVEIIVVLNDDAPFWNPASLAPLRQHRIVHAERDLRQLVNGYEAARILYSERPDVLVSMGASPAVPFFLLGRAIGLTTVFIETFGSVSEPSLTARLVYPLTQHFFVQWPALLRHFPRARDAGSVFVAGQQAMAPALPGPPALFVALGTSPRPMRRLYAWLDQLLAEGALPGQVLVQGPSDGRDHAFARIDRLPEPLLLQHLASAPHILVHGGAGLLGSCVELGRVPLVVPRVAAHDEAVNDHQGHLTTALASRGQALPCPSLESLRHALAHPAPPARLSPSSPSSSLTSQLLAVLQQVAQTRGCLPPTSHP